MPVCSAAPLLTVGAAVSAATVNLEFVRAFFVGQLIAVILLAVMLLRRR